MIRNLCAALFALAALAAASPAAAQWAWRDANGRMVVSDQAPPAGVKESQIVRRPGASGSRPAPAPVAEPAPAPVAGSTTQGADAGKPQAPRPLTVADQEAQFRKRLADKEANEKKQAAENKRSAENADSCQRMRSSLAALDSGRRIARYNAQGETEVLDDTARAAEADRLRRQIDEYCR
jgi:Domain of unknown function (DUF4124)